VEAESERIQQEILDFYQTPLTKEMLEEESRLPAMNLAGVGVIEVAGNLVRIDSAIDTHELFLQTTIDRHPGVWILFSLAWPLRKSTQDETLSIPSDVSLLLPPETSLDTLVKQFFHPLVVAFLQSEETSIIVADLQAKWLRLEQSYSNKAQPEGVTHLLNVENVGQSLASADFNDKAYTSFALFILAELLRFLVHNQENYGRYARMVRNPLVLQATLVLYVYLRDLREHAQSQANRVAERRADSTMVVDYLAYHRSTTNEAPLAALGLFTLASLEQLPERGSEGRTLKAKYASVHDLLPLKPGDNDPVPLVLSHPEGYIHRWNLARFCLRVIGGESDRIARELAGQWSRQGIPDNDKWTIPEELLSEAVEQALKLFHQWRSLATDRALFIACFFPTADEPKGAAFRHMTWEGQTLATPEQIMDTLDKLVYRSRTGFERRKLVDILRLDHGRIARSAWAMLAERVGPVRYILYRFLRLLGLRLKVPAIKKAETLTVSAAQSVPAEPDPSGIRSTPRNSRLAGTGGAEVGKPTKKASASESLTAATTNIVKLIQGIKDLDGEIDRLHASWSMKAPATVSRDMVDRLILKEVMGRFAFATMTMKDGEDSALEYIDDHKLLSKFKDPNRRTLARYMFLVGLRARLRTL